MIKIVHTITQLQSMYYVINIPLTLLAFSALTRRLVSLLHGGPTFRTPAAAACTLLLLLLLLLMLLLNPKPSRQYLVKHIIVRNYFS